MKKHKLLIAILIVTLGFGHDAFSNSKDFSGVIIYNITYDDAKMDPQMSAMMPKTLKLIIKEGKTRAEMSMGMGKSINIFDSETMSGLMLMDMMGQKFAIELSTDDINKELEKAPDLTVEKFDDTKEIAGYACKRAVVKTLKSNGDVESELEVYYTDELGSGVVNMDNPMFKDIPGVMLEYSIDENDVKMKLTAISVEQKKVSDSEFEIPEGFKKVTQEELQNMFGG
jgi:GLPGLI family protein